jgi:hypothetical protein
MLIGSAPRGLAQSACVCSYPDTDVLLEPDTVFHIVDRFDAALCGHIDRSVQPFVYSAFTIRSCITVARTPLRIQSPAHDCHITVSGGMLVVDELRALPTGPDMALATRPCWRTYYVLRVHEDTEQYAINAMKELIADLPKPTPEQVARTQARWDALPPTIYWTSYAEPTASEAPWRSSTMNCSRSFMRSGRAVENNPLLARAFFSSRSVSRRIASARAFSITGWIGPSYQLGPQIEDPSPSFAPQPSPMPNAKPPQLKDGDHCVVVAGTHKGKSGVARDLNISKMGHLTITVVQADGLRFKALGKNVVVQTH